MLSSVLLSALAVSSTPLPPSVAPVEVSISQDVDHETEIAAAGDDVEKILELARAWKADRQSAAAKAAFNKVLELDAENEEAHKGLRHHKYDNKWFESYSALSKYKREESARMKEQGLSKLGDEWVPTEDLPFLKMGWSKDESGKWLDPFFIKIDEMEAQMQAEGRQLRAEDSTWVHPDDFEKWQEGLWQVGEDWVSTEEANKFHSEIGRWWHTRGERFELFTTCDMDTMLWARWHADQAFADLAKIFGVQPERRPLVVVLRDIEQFNMFAAGSQEKQLQPAESSGFSSLHHAYFADSWYMGGETPRFLGTGVGYWDAGNKDMAPFGKHSVRHAAGLAYAEAIAPSLMTIANAVSASSPPNLQEFWAEKPIPRWLIYGASAYAERYYKDGNAEDPMWPRAWSLTNLRNQGDLDTLEAIFTFNLSLEAIEASTRLINEAGLVVSFMIDGGCGPVIEAHRAYKSALKSGKGAKEAAEALQAAVIANKDAFDQYVATN